ncbi:MAG: peptidoglycan DD-metalloendopeptidase family protein [Clostridiales bacterium]|nr:peptidoglycan DD-metalloendopeptidase family protein [Clostridiales bacterium]
MENKIKKKSINTVIYLLLAAMLVCVVFVSVYTVAGKRSKPTPNPDDTLDTLNSDTSANTDPVTGESKPSGKDKTDAKTLDTDKANDTTPADTSADSAAVTDADTLPTAITDGEELPASIEARYFVMPVNGIAMKGFDIDVPVYSLTMNDYRAHTGIDISAPIGSDVISVSSGTVCRIWNDPMMGRSVTVDHGDGIYSTYMNLADELSPEIMVGTKIALGQAIGTVGESALIEIAEEPHVHLEMKINGQYVDPFEYISVSNDIDDIDDYYED